MTSQEPLDVPLIAKVDFLTKASTYPDRPTGVEAIETHMSWIFLTDRYAYKLKKPVVFDFLDYRMIEARRLCCEAEVTLNQRLAAGMYLGAVPLALTKNEQLGLHGDGVAVDWLVQMQRLPMKRRLDVCINTDRVDHQGLADALAGLFAGYQTADDIGLSASDYRERLEVAIRRNGFAMEILDQHHVIERQLEFLKDRHEMVAGRADFVIDAHGDLRPDVLALMAAAVTTPLGMLVSYPVVTQIQEPALGALLALSAGALVYVGATHLLPSAEREPQRFSLIALATGIVVAIGIVFGKGGS